MHRHARFLALTAAFALLPLSVACGKKKDDKAAAPKTGAPVAVSPGDKPVADLKAGDKPAEPATKMPVATDPVAAYVAALEATADCPLADDKVAAKDYSACLKPMWDAAKSIDDPQGMGDDYTAKQAKSKELKAALAKQLELALSHKNRTVVLYAVFQNQQRLDYTPTVLARLEQLMDDSHEATAEWAAIGRFYTKDKADTATIAKAQSVLKEHKLSSVRRAAIQYLGDATFKGERSHFDLLKTYADDKAADKLVRSTALTHLGTIGNEKDIKVIAGYLKDKDLQYSAVYTLKHGLRTKAANDAYLNYFVANAKKPGTIDFGTLMILAPFEMDLPMFDVKKATKAMNDIIATTGHEPFVVDQAKQTLAKLAALPQK